MTDLPLPEAILSAATPRPWFIEDHSAMDATRSRIILFVGDSDQDRADLALVVEAVNEYEALRAFRDESGHRAVWSAEEVAVIHEALFDLCEAVSDFHTSITCMDSELVIPDMLAAMDHSQRRARAALARVRGPGPAASPVIRRDYGPGNPEWEADPLGGGLSREAAE